MEGNSFQTRRITEPEDTPKAVFGKPALRQISRHAKPHGKIARAWAYAVTLWHRRPRNKQEWKRFLKRIILWGSGALALYFLFLWITLPNISDARSLLASQSTVITDRNGVELYRLFDEEDRTRIPGDQIPEYMKHAIIAIEDERYYERDCIDIRALARAVFRFGQAGGASTITRQLARNALDLRNENIINRKLKELILGCQMEWSYSKDELLELYLNWIPFGQNAYGIEQASQVYFGTSAKDLTLAQSAVLAALPQRPSYFSPYGNHVRTSVSDPVIADIVTGDITETSDIPDEETSIGLLGNRVGTGSTLVYIGGRSDQVLKNMLDQEFITEENHKAALAELEAMVFEPSREDIRAAHFVLWVKAQVEELLAGTSEQGLLEQGGLTIETTLDWNMQEAAEQVVANYTDDAKTYGADNIALVALDPETREIMAYVGNTDYNDEVRGGKIDMVQAPRQPGSSFKPFIYTAAFLKGYSPATILYDVPTKFGEDEPQNFDAKFWGLMTARRALGASRNVPAAKAFFLAGGEDPILALVEELGAPTPKAMKERMQAEQGPDFEYGWPLALGAAETPLLEMAQAYSTIAAGGMHKSVVSIRKITHKGNILYETELDPGDQVLDPRIAYQITSILSDASVRPNEYWASVLTVPGYASAAKTGTSNKCLERDDEGGCKDRKPDNLWTMGYTPSLVAGVWVGNADSSALSEKAESLTLAAPIWKDFMNRAHKHLETSIAAFAVPSNIVQPQISLLSGELPTECTPVQFRKPEVFLAERPPTKEDPACVKILVDKVTGLLASDACPEDAREEQSFLVPVSVAAERWPLWEHGVQEWAKKEMEVWNATPTHTGSLLPLPAIPTEKCDPSLTPGRLVKPEVTIDFPSDGGGAGYPSFRPRIDYDVGSTVREVVYLVDGKEVGKSSLLPFEPNLRIPRSIAEEGNHTLEVRLTDEYYNIATDKVSFRFEEDRSGPDVLFTMPPSDVTLPVGAQLQMRVDADDPSGSLKYVQFYLGDTLLSTKPKEPFTLTYTLDVEPGTYELRAHAEDEAGNTSEDTRMVTVTEEGEASSESTQ